MHSRSLPNAPSKNDAVLRLQTKTLQGSGQATAYECAVIAVPNEMRGEMPKALVALKDNTVTSEQDRLGFLKDRLAKFKVPKSIEFFPSLPKGGTDKILKKELRERYWTGQAKQVQ